MAVVKSSGVYKSTAVSRDASHHHKTWSCEVIQTGGFFEVVSYAQLFVQQSDGTIVPEQKRVYPLRTFRNQSEAERELALRVSSKKKGKSRYEPMNKPDGSSITADEKTIIQFLQKYSFETS